MEYVLVKMQKWIKFCFKHFLGWQFKVLIQFRIYCHNRTYFATLEWSDISCRIKWKMSSNKPLFYKKKWRSEFYYLLFSQIKMWYYILRNYLPPLVNFFSTLQTCKSYTNNMKFPFYTVISFKENSKNVNRQLKISKCGIQTMGSG